MTVKKFNNFINETKEIRNFVDVADIVNTINIHELRNIKGKYEPIKSVTKNKILFLEVKKLVLNKCVDFKGWNYSNENSSEIQMLVERVDFNDFNKILFGGILLKGSTKSGVKTPDEFYAAVKEDDVVYILNVDAVKLIEEIEKKKDEIRIKMLDVDPYGEEDWGEEENLDGRWA